jgi:hypothetical protein
MNPHRRRQSVRRRLPRARLEIFLREHPDTERTLVHHGALPSDAEVLTDVTSGGWHRLGLLATLVIARCV